MMNLFYKKNKELAEKNQIPYPAIMAHRGLSYYAPEETLPAYLLALEIGENIYLEADIQRTKDGVLVCFHDDDLKRTTNIEEIIPEKKDYEIQDFTFDELKQLDLGSWFNQKYPERARQSYKGLKIFTLEELADLAKTKTNLGLYLETKSAHKFPGIEKDLVLLLYRKGWILKSEISEELYPEIQNTIPEKEVNFSRYKRVIFQSFEIESLKFLKQYAPGIPRVFLVDEEMSKKEGGFLRLIQLAKSVDAHLGPSGYLGLPWNQYFAIQNERLVHHYTINQVNQIRLLYFFGSAGIFTDRADIALKFFFPEKYSNLSIQDLLKKIGY
ncbi:MAG: glycerophosphodiester phosphodiesterase family protein [Leptonema sp. (in: bacteria)]